MGIVRSMYASSAPVVVERQARAVKSSNSTAPNEKRSAARSALDQSLTCAGAAYHASG